MPNDSLATDVHVSRWQAGDESAFAILYERFAPLIEVRVRRSRHWRGLHVTYQVEDIVQEAWLRVLPAGKLTFTSRGPGSFLGYVARVADNTMVDLVRRATTQKRGDGKAPASLDTEAALDPAVQPGRNGFVTPTSAARCSELKALAEEILQERELVAWQLIELEGYTASEVWLALDTSGSAARGLLLRACARLAVALDAGNEE